MLFRSTEPLRLNKFLANAGVCSRREADEFIQAGLVLSLIHILQDMVSSAVEKGVSAIDEINQTLALSLARQAAIPQGQILSNEEMGLLWGPRWLL